MGASRVGHVEGPRLSTSPYITNNVLQAKSSDQRSLIASVARSMPSARVLGVSSCAAKPRLHIGWISAADWPLVFAAGALMMIMW